MSSRESTEQGRSGRSGSEASQEPGRGKQPRQTSERVEAAPLEDEPKHTFEPGRRPSEQGEIDNPGPERIAHDQSGFGGSGSGGGQAGGDRSEEEAQRGSPRHDHTRQGRQSAPGNRSPAD